MRNQSEEIANDLIIKTARLSEATLTILLGREKCQFLSGKISWYLRVWARTTTGMYS